MVLEEEGAIVPERGANGYRLYSERQLRQAWIAQRLKAAGVSAAEVRAVMAIKRGAATRAGKFAATVEALEAAKARLVERRRAADEAIQRLDSLIAECRSESSARGKA